MALFDRNQTQYKMPHQSVYDRQNHSPAKMFAIQPPAEGPTVQAQRQSNKHATPIMTPMFLSGLAGDVKRQW